MLMVQILWSRSQGPKREDSSEGAIKLMSVALVVVENTTVHYCRE